MRLLSKLIAVLLTLFLSTACSPREPVEASAEDSANSAWETLTSSPPDSASAADGAGWIDLVRRAELANQRRRDLGLEFWDAHPRDPRRYSWLILAVHMAPEYPKGIDALDYDSLAPVFLSTAPQDTEKVKLWRQRYPELRQAFFASDKVSDEQKRFLWYGELRGQIRDIRRAQARSEIADLDGFLRNYLSFVAAYPEPFSDASATRSERGVHNKMMNALFFAVFDLHRDAFEWQPNTALETLQTIQSSWSHGPLRRMIAHIEEHGDLPPKSDGILYKLDQLTVEQRAWRWADRFSVVKTTSSQIIEARVVSAYERLLLQNRQRGLGLRLWTGQPDPAEQLRWYSSLPPADDPIFHIRDMEDGLWLIANGRSEDIEIDEANAKDWFRRLGELRDEFWSNPATEGALRGRWAGLEAKSLKEAFDSKGPTQMTPRDVARLHQSVLAVVDQFGADDVSLSTLRDMITYPGRYGFSDTSLSQYIDRLRAMDGEALKAVISFYDLRQEMRQNPVDFIAEVFGEEAFVQLSEYRGKYVYLDPWATWCSPCIEAMPELHETYLDYQDRGFEFLSMVNDSERNPKGVRRVIESYDLTWPVIVADELHLSRPELNAYILIGPAGQVIAFQDRIYGLSLRETLENLLPAR